MEEGFKRGQQQGQGCAQFVADVGEEAALDLVKFNQLLVAFFDHAATLVQFPSQFELTITPTRIGYAAANHNHRRQHQEGRVVN